MTKVAPGSGRAGDFIGQVGCKMAIRCTAPSQRGDDQDSGGEKPRQPCAPLPRPFPATVGPYEEQRETGVEDGEEGEEEDDVRSEWLGASRVKPQTIG